MKPRYLFIGGWKAPTPFYKEVITKEDLALVVNSDVEFIIDLVNGTYFDYLENTWKEIKTIS